MELRALGHEVVLVPLYLPLFSEGEELGSADVPIFYGAVGVYLAQFFPMLNKAPRWLKTLMDSRRLLRWVAKKSSTTRASGLEKMTLSVLRGEMGGQKNELDHLMSWLTHHAKPDVVHLSNALLLGLAGRIKRELGVPVVCTLQDEDSWIDSMQPHAAKAAWQIMDEKAADIAAFIPVSDYYRSLMQARLQSVTSEHFHIIPIGIHPNQYGPAPMPPKNPVIGYLSKMTESLGLETIIDAFIQLKRSVPLAPLKLRVMGGKTPDDNPFLQRLRNKLAAEGMLTDVEFCEGLTKECRTEFLQSLSVLSVPMPHPEAFGMFILESLACAVPVVQPRIGAFPEIISTTGGGLCYDPNEPGALAMTLKSFLLNPEEAQRVGRIGCENVCKLFNVKNTAKSILKIYLQCLSDVNLSTRTLAFFLLASCLTCFAQPQAPTNWPTFHGDARLRGVSSSAVSNTLSIGWRFKVGAPVSRPPIAYNGLIYVLSDRGEAIALNSDGSKCWTSTLPRQPQPEFFSTPPLRVDDSLLAGTDRGYVYAFNAGTGAFRWKVKIGEDIYGALNWLEPEGTNNFSVLALSRNDGRLFRLDLSSGRVIWASKPAGRSDGSPAVGNGIIVFGACDAALHFISPLTGDSIAKTDFSENGPMAGGAALDGRLAFIGTRNGSVLCIDTTSFKPVWTRQVASNEVFSTPAITSHCVVTSAGDGSISCLNRADGKIIWQIFTSDSPASPVIAGDKVIETAGGTLLLLRLEDGRTLWSDKPCDSLTSPAVVDGKVIVGTDDGFIILYQ